MVLSTFYAPATNYISTLSQFTSSNLLSLPTRKTFRKALKRAMFNQLSHLWTTLTDGRHTFQFIQSWQPVRFPLKIKSRALETIYIKCVFRNNDSRASRAERHQINASCPHCSLSETIEHIFLVCPAYAHARTLLFDRVGSDCSLRSLLCTPDNRAHVEAFIKTTSLLGA